MKIKNLEEISLYLEEFGLSDIETKLYLTLLSTGPSTIMDLSRESGVKRSTTHHNVEGLLKIGMVAQTDKGGRRMVFAESPEKLYEIIEDKKWKIEKLENQFSSIVDQLNNALPEETISKQPTVKYYTGETGFKNVIERSLDFAKDEILFISNLDEWYKVYTHEYDEKHYIPRRLERGINIRLLVKKSKLTKKMKRYDEDLKREIRFLEEDNELNTTMIVYGNEISITLSSKPYTAIVISNQEVANTFRSVFNSLWKKR